MKKTLLCLVASAGLIAGCTHQEAVKETPKIEARVEQAAKEDKPSVTMSWNGYKIDLGKISYTFKVEYSSINTTKRCVLNLDDTILDDTACDNSVDWIHDRDGTCWRKSGPKERFDMADKLLGKYKNSLNIENFHLDWLQVRWDYDPLKRL